MCITCNIKNQVQCTYREGNRQGQIMGVCHGCHAVSWLHPPFGLNCITGVLGDFQESLKWVKILSPFSFHLKDTPQPRPTFPHCPGGVPAVWELGLAADQDNSSRDGQGRVPFPMPALNWAGWVKPLTRSPISIITSPDEPCPCLAWLARMSTPKQWRKHKWHAGEWGWRHSFEQDREWRGDSAVGILKSLQ